MRPKTKRRIAVLAASTVLCVAGLGVGAGTASAGQPVLDTPAMGKTVTGPSQAAGGAATAVAAIGASPAFFHNPLGFDFVC